MVTNDKLEQSKFNKKFYKDNQEKIKEIHICNECLGKYTYFNKWHHLKSKKHINTIILLEQKINEFKINNTITPIV